MSLSLWAENDWLRPHRTKHYYTIMSLPMTVGADAAEMAAYLRAGLDATLPRFRAQPEGLLSALSRATPDLVIMALYASVALLLAFAGFLRYDVR